MGKYFDQVPKPYYENLEYRKVERVKCIADPAYRTMMWHACQDDILFWLSAFCWLFEPRIREYKGKRLPPIIPFIPWPHQIEPILGIRENLGKVDVAIKKSRGEGLSWILCLMALHDWLFIEMAQIGLVSSKEANVDIAGNLNTLFGKILWELDQLPNWMSGVRNKDYRHNGMKHTLVKLEDNATITGYAATSDVASGSRALWFGFDELSKFPRPDDEAAMTAVQQVTDSRFVVATPLGSQGAYYELMHEPSNLVKYTLAWYDNPTRNRGLYKMKGNRPVAIDPENNPLPKHYDPPTKKVVQMYTRLRRKGFILQNCIRSPWFDNECDRPRATPQSIAQELGMDFGGSQANVFSEAALTIMAETSRMEMARGNLSYHPETLKHKWDRVDDGECYLWCPLDSQDNPPPGTYVASADISTGDASTYTSNSVLSVFNAASREQVFEWASNSTRPSDFADYSIAVCNWFHGALLGWEQNGPGGPYSTRLFEQKYENLHRRVVIHKRSRRQTKEYGWWSDLKTKELLFADMITGIIEGELVVRSKYVREEAIQYIRRDGLIVHGGHALKGVRDSGQHGDRVIAVGIGNHMMKDMPMEVVASRKIPNPKIIPVNSLAYRERYFARKKREKSEGLDLRTMRDLLK